MSISPCLLKKVALLAALAVVVLLPNELYARSCRTSFARSVFFEPGSSVLRVPEIEKLTSLKGEVLPNEHDLKWDSLVAIVVGHAAKSEGNDGRKRELGLKRANSVKKVLANNILPFSEIQVYSKGSVHSAEFTEVENRRVEIEVIGIRAGCMREIPK